MQEINKEYLTLFNAVTDTLELLNAVTDRLVAAQQRAEELYIKDEE